MSSPRPLAMLAAMLVIASSAAPAGAATASFGLKALDAPRGYFVVQAAPGAVVHERLRVVNVGPAAGVVTLRAADAATGRTTGAVYQAGARRATGSWISVDRERLALGPRRSAVVGVTVRVPESASPGDHLGGVVAEPERGAAATVRQRSGRSFHVKVVEQSVVAVQVRVPGPAREELALTGIRAGADPGFQTLLVGIANPGGLLARGRGVVKVIDATGRVVRRQRFAVDTFVPGTRVEDPVVVRGRALPAGAYTASVLIRWGAGRSTTLHAPFSVSSGQLRKVYGSPGVPALSARARDRSSRPSLMVIGGGAVLLVLAGAGGAALVLRRRSQPLAPALRPPEADGVQARVEDRRPSPEAGSAQPLSRERD